MKTKSILAVVLAAVIALASLMLFAGCGKEAETTPESTESAEEKQPNLFTKGVWLGNIDGNADTYFLFNDDKSGRTERADGTGGVPFTCEQNGLDVVFHFGSADDVTNAKFDLGNNTGTFDYGENKVTYEFVFVDGADPESFEVPAPEPLFGKGVWSASIDGKIDTYFIFDDKSNGRTERADGTGGVSFTCEQNGPDIVFHFGSVDDVTNAKFSTGDNTGTFEYGEETVVYNFESVPGADPDNFEIPTE